jgi:hypothetical protein
MQTPSNIFGKLYARLTEIESQKVDKFSSGNILKEAGEIIYQIEKYYRTLEPQIINKSFTALIAQTNRILEAGIKDYTENSYSEDVPWKDTDTINDEVNKELILYLENLYRLLEQWSKEREEASTTVTPTQFNLPEGFTVEDITNAGFVPMLNQAEATYLLYILRYLKLSPDYNDGSLAQLASALFGRSNNTIRRELGKVAKNIKKEASQENLLRLKAKIKNIMTVIDEWLIEPPDM